MNQENERINLEEISKIPEDEFKKYFKEWLENDEIARGLQAKLRKDLIVNFNKTSLGRKMFFQHVNSQRMILSPLILALNTLVAEFLYAQDCHFSLSVFCTEVPYRNVLPDFESSKHFRFAQTEILEIFNAIDGYILPEIKNNICTEYQNNFQGSVPVSLLFVIFKNLLSQKIPEFRNDSPKNCNENLNKANSIIENDNNSKNTSKKDSNIARYNNNFRYLNKYLIILSRKVKEMSNNFETLHKPNISNCQRQRKTLGDRKFDYINRSLEKMSENLKNLSLHKKRNRRISNIVQAIEQMAKQFEKCSQKFEEISNNKSSYKPEDRRDYIDWINELNKSKSGKKFISKIETALHKNLEREKQRMAEEFSKKLENEKELLRLKYKHKYLELKSQEKQSKEDNELNQSIDKKLKDFDTRHQELLQKVAENENYLKNSRNFLNEKQLLGNEITNVSQTSNVNDVKMITSKKNNNTKFEPNLQEMAKTIAKKERHIDHIVFDAKLRIQELENESVQLDKAFQDYLRRQQAQKIEADDDVKAIWQKYQFDKEMLNKKCTLVRDQMPNKQKNQLMKQLESNTLDTKMVIRDIPKINVNHVDDDYESNIRISDIEFENPFRELQKSFSKNPFEVLDEVKKNRGPKSSSLKTFNDSKKSTELLVETESSAPTSIERQGSCITELNLKNVTLDGVDISSVQSSSSSDVRPAVSYLKPFKSKRRLFGNENTNESKAIKNLQPRKERKRLPDEDILKTSEQMKSETKKLYERRYELPKPPDANTNLEIRDIHPETSNEGNNAINIDSVNNTNMNDQLFIKINSSRIGSNSSASNETGLSQFILNSQKQNSKIEANSPNKSKSNENIFQLSSFRKDEDIDKLSENSVNIRKNVTQKEEINEVRSPLFEKSSSSNLSLNISVGGQDKEENSLDDFWN